MARTYGPRASHKTRNRAYTVLALLIIVLIIAYIYSPLGDGQSDPNDRGLPMAANNTTVHSNFGSSNVSQDIPEQEEINGESSLQVASPDWESLQSINETLPNPSRDTIQESNIRDIRNLTTTNESELTQQTSVGSTPASSQANPGTGQVTTTIPKPAVQTNSEADKLITEATEMMKSPSKVLEARDMFNDALRSRTITAQQAKLVKVQLSELADDWLFNRTAVPGDNLCEHYKVQSGDQLRIIGDKHKVPYEFLMEINNISDARLLRAGQTIKVINGPFHAKVYRSTFTMDVYLQNTYVRTFTVGLGLPGSETPTGTWRVEPGGKLIKPEWTDSTGKVWYPSDPDYPLGSRWIALEGLEGEAEGREGFAIHGTHKPQELGTQGSQGCIRMENGAAIMVYNMLFPAYSTVEVLD